MFLTRISLAVAMVFSMATISIAADSFMVGPRALGMAGANIASTKSSTAQYYNPAAFGFFGKTDEDGKKLKADNNDLGSKDFGGALDATAGVRMFNDFGDYVETLADVDYDMLSQGGVQSESDLADLINLANSLAGIDDPGNAIVADFNGGTSFRFGSFGLGVRGYGEVSGMVIDLDRANLGLAASGASLSEDINSIALPTNDNQQSLFTPGQVADLLAAGFDNAAIQRLDYIARQEGVDLEQTTGLIDLLSDIGLQSGGGGTLENNTTTVMLSGFGIAEVPLSYGYAINDHVSIGVNAKVMTGRVYGTELVVFDNDTEQMIKKADENYAETTTWGVDVGVMARFNKFNLGLVGRNLNTPTFDGPVVNGTKFADVELEPQVAAGIAYIPFETLTLEVDYDITENETSLTSYATQRVSVGAEWDAFKFLALRAGGYKNLADDESDWVVTAGLGLNLWAVRFDIGAAASLETVDFDGDEVPTEARVGAQLAFDF